MILVPVSLSNGEQYENEFDMLHTQMFGRGGVYDPKTDTFTIDEEPTPKEIYFVRHGDTPLNKEGEKSDDRAPVRGWNDTSLNEQGRAQAAQAAEKLSKEPITHIVTSDLPRASETASIIGDKLGITPEEHPGLRTWNLGEYTGKTGEDVHDAVDRLCLHAPDERPPGGESFNEFKDRILTTFGQIAQDHREHEILVVSHNSPERILNAFDKAGQPESREIDRKSYHSDEGAIDPGQHKMLTIENPLALANHPDPFQQAFSSTAEQAKQETDPFRKAAQVARAGVVSLAGKAAGMVTAPIEAIGRVAERYTRAIQAARGETPELNEELDDQTNHVLDMMTILGATGGLVSAPEGALAANRLKIVPSKAGTGGELTEYKILRNTPEGEKEVGYVQPSYHSWDKSVHINMIRTSEKSTLERGNTARKLNAHAHAFTSSEVRDLFREMAREFPEAESVEGWRISGAHSNQAAALRGGGSIRGWLSTAVDRRSFNDSVQRIPIPQSLRDKYGKPEAGTDPLSRSLGQIAKKNVEARRAAYDPNDPKTWAPGDPGPVDFSAEPQFRNNSTYEEMVRNLNETMNQRLEDREHDPYHQVPYVEPPPTPVNPQRNYRTLSEAEELTRDYATEVRRAHPNADVRTESAWTEVGPTENPYTNASRASQGNRHTAVVSPEFWNLNTNAHVHHYYNDWSASLSRPGLNWVGEQIPGGIHEVPGTTLASKGSAEVDALLESLRQGKTNKEIAKDLGVPVGKAKDLVKFAKEHLSKELPEPINPEPGSENFHPNSPFYKEVNNLKKDFEAGMNNSELAAKYRVTRPAIIYQRKRLGYPPSPAPPGRKPK